MHAMKAFQAAELMLRVAIGLGHIAFVCRCLFVTHEPFGVILFSVNAFLVLVPPKYDLAILLKEWTLK